MVAELVECKDPTCNRRWHFANNEFPHMNGSWVGAELFKPPYSFVEQVFIDYNQRKINTVQAVKRIEDFYEA